MCMKEIVFFLDRRLPLLALKSCKLICHTYVMHRESVEGRRKTKQRNIKSFFGKIHLCKVELILLSFLFFKVLYSVVMRWQFFLLSVFLMTMSSLSCKRYCVFCLLLYSVFSQFVSSLFFVRSSIKSQVRSLLVKSKALFVSSLSKRSSPSLFVMSLCKR